VTNWPEVRLGDACDRITDGSHFSPKSSSEGFPYVTVRDLSDGAIDLDGSKRISRESFNELSRNGCSPQKGDVLFSKDGTVGKVALVGVSIPFVVLSSIAILSPNHELVSSEYLAWVLKSPSVQSMAVDKKTGTALRRLILRDLNSILIPLPPLDEQKRIVAKLDEAREVLDRMRVLRISKGRSAVSLESALLADIVSASDPTDFEVDLGEITSKIGSGATPRGGSNSYLESGISLIRSLNVHDAEFRRKNLAFISNDQAKLLANVKVDSGDVLLNITGASIARTCVVPADLLPARVNQHVAILRARPELVHPDYLALVMVSEGVKQRLLSIGEGAGTTRQALTKLDLMKFSLRIPRDLNVQERRVSYAQSIQGQIARFQRVHNESLQRLSLLEAQTLAAALKGEL